jgi:hypothetical protein
MPMKYPALTLAAFTLLACDDAATTATSSPAVGSASDLSSFEGARAGQAEMGIQTLGYEAIRSEGLTTWWFNRQTGACARITTSDGRYSDVTMLPAEDC